jgi:hypothetical protein
MKAEKSLKKSEDREESLVNELSQTEETWKQ